MDSAIRTDTQAWTAGCVAGAHPRSSSVRWHPPGLPTSRSPNPQVYEHAASAIVRARNT
jgi:hypothetical protein